MAQDVCSLVSDDDDGTSGGGQGGGLRARVVEPKTVDSDTLQSPHDPDATYRHEGKG